MNNEAIELFRTIDRIIGSDFDGDAINLGRALNDEEASYALFCLVEKLKIWKEDHGATLLAAAGRGDADISKTEEAIELTQQALRNEHG